MRSNAKRQEIVNTESYFQIVKRQISDQFPTEDISELKGDSAAHVKVSNQGLSEVQTPKCAQSCHVLPSHYREVRGWEIFMEQELRFWLDLGRFGNF